MENKEIKIAVVGSRTINDYKFVKETLQFLIEKFEKQNNQKPNYHIISGGAQGVDSDAVRFAKENGFIWTEHLPRWNDYGKSAGFIRNAQIVDECDILICFWDGESKGAKHSYDLAKKKNKEIYMFLNSDRSFL